VGTTTDNGARLQVAGSGTFTTGVNMATTSGNTGIGTTAPAYKLDVNGTLGVTGAATLNSSLTAGVFNQNTPVLFSTDNTNNSPALTIFKNTTANDQDIFRVQKFVNMVGVTTVASINSAGSATFSGTLGVAGGTQLATSSGNVLIGTTTDNGARLQVSGNQTISGTLGVTSAINQGGSLVRANGASFTNANVTQASTTANVYITTSDAQAIDKGGSLGFGGQYGSGDVPFAVISGRKENGTNNSYNGYFVVSTQDDGASMIERLRISSTGAATFSSLAGTGTRMVTANSSGQLEATQVVTWNSYTASVGDRINHTCGTTAVFPRYTVVGNIVTVQGTVSVGCITSADTYTEFSIPLPITGSATTGSAIMIGTGTLIDGNGKTANSANYRVVNVDLSAGKAYVNFYPRTNGNSSNVSFFFQYSIN
jgi:hypothetical protein